jgi:hypothetical protein
LRTAHGLASFIPLYLVFDLFYKLHPEYIVHGIEMKFGVRYFLTNIRGLLSSFLHINLFSTSFFWIWPVMFLVFCAGLFRSEKRAFYAMLVLLATLFAALFSEKVGDGTSWTFYSISRMYIGIPMVFALFTSLIRSRAMPALIAVPLIVIPFSCYKIAKLEGDVKSQTDPALTFWFGVRLLELDRVEDAIGFYKKVCIANGVNELLISNFFWMNTYVAYGGPATDTQYPVTMEINHEKRLYVKKAAGTLKPERFILQAEYSDLEKLLTDLNLKLKRIDDYGLFLVTENRYSFAELSAILIEREWKMHKMKEFERFGTQ